MSEKFRPTHEQRMSEFIIKTACYCLGGCILLIPALCIIPSLFPNAIVPNIVWDLLKILPSLILGYIFGYGSGTVPKT